jgi:hypothetical protein
MKTTITEATVHCTQRHDHLILIGTLYTKSPLLGVIQYKAEGAFTESPLLGVIQYKAEGATIYYDDEFQKLEITEMTVAGKKFDQPEKISLAFEMMDINEDGLIKSIKQEYLKRIHLKETESKLEDDLEVLTILRQIFSNQQ